MNLLRLCATGALLLVFASPALATPANVANEPLRNGSRSKAGDGSLIVYDAVTGVWAVPKRDDVYWIVDRFYQYDNGVWSTSPALAGPWTLTARRLVPEVVRERYAPPRTAVTAKLPSGHEAVYEPRLKIYRMAGIQGVFLYEGLFFRYQDGVWLESEKEEGPWKLTSEKSVSPPLRAAVPVPKNGQKVTLPSGDVAVFNAKNEYFTLESRPEVVLYDGTFYEKRDKKWFSSLQAGGEFQAISGNGKPPGNVRKWHPPRKPGDKPGTPKAPGDKPAAEKHPGGAKAEGAARP